MSVAPAMLGMLVKALGIGPEHLQSAMALVQGLSQDRVAFKAGAGEMVSAFHARLDQIEATQNRILAMQDHVLAVLRTITPHDNSVVVIEGETDHERHINGRHPDA